MIRLNSSHLSWEKKCSNLKTVRIIISVNNEEIWISFFNKKINVPFCGGIVVVTEENVVITKKLLRQSEQFSAESDTRNKTKYTISNMKPS